MERLGRAAVAKVPGECLPQLPDHSHVELVCDNARDHHTEAVRAFMESHADRLTIEWLLPYCPSFNLIERLWGHLKRTVMANVLFKTPEDLAAAFHRSVGHINGHRDTMEFTFDHDTILKNAA